MKFWDASAIVPLVSREQVSARGQRLLTSDPGLMVWILTPVEVHSALLRKRRSQLLTAAELRESRERLEELSQSWSQVQPVDSVIARAIRALELHELRAADALQLGAALVACQGEPRRLPFVVLDQKLASAAEREGFLVVVP